MALTQTAVRSMDVPFNQKAAGERAAKPSNIRRIQNQNFGSCVKGMGSWQAIGQLGKHLAYRHRVGLLMTSVVVLLSYVAYDKVLSVLFF
jgi:hypothetical protein